MFIETVRELIQLRSYLRQRLVTGSATQMPEPLYHYTDAAGLLGIVTSGTVWATHYAYLNDASEFKYAVDLMEGVVEEATADAEPDSWKAHCLYAVVQGDSKSHYSVGSAHVTDEQQFVACFSEAGDRLSQWRGYGKSIGGYALGFPFDHLRAIEKQINDSQAGKTCDESNPQITVSFGRCWYDQQAQKKLLAEAFDRVLRHLETLSAPTSLDHDAKKKRFTHPDNWLPGLLNAIPRALSPYFKDPAFEEEREWRLVVRVWRPGSGSSVSDGDDRERTQDDIRMDQIATVHFRKGEYSLVPYVVVPVVLDAALSLSQVVVGPTPLPENARAAAMQLLRPEPKGSRTPISAPAGRRIVCTNIVSSSIPFRRV